ncbi:MAG: metallophosphoesterase [Oscillospiraceae bacterium]|nr:metallophosphoesterase [Oscillospiraceae bacterium]
MKKCVSILSAVALLCLGASPARAAPRAAAAGGAYRVLVFSDVHQRANEGAVTTAFMNAALKHYAGKLDLVVFTGDIMCQTACATVESIRAAVRVVLAPVKAAAVPFVIVFGNHDYGDVPETVKTQITKTGILQMYIEEGAGLCVNAIETAYADANGGITNFGFPIQNDADEDFAALYFFDEGGHKPGVGGDRAVMQDQLAVFARDQAAWGYPQTFVFQHIALPEVYDAALQAPKYVPGLTGGWDGNAHLLLPGLRMDGVMLEPPCPPHFSDGEYEALTAEGNVRAVFFGHDHVNDYVVRDEAADFDMVNIPGLCWEVYGTFPLRGARLITLTQGAGGKVGYAQENYTYLRARLTKGSGVTKTVADASDFFRGVFQYSFAWLWNAMLQPVRYFARFGK